MIGYVILESTGRGQYIIIAYKAYRKKRILISNPLLSESNRLDNESAVGNNDKAIQENFLHVETAAFLKEKIVLSLRTDVCKVAVDNKSVVVRANGVSRPAQGDASRKLLHVQLTGDITVRNETGVQPRVLVELTHSKRELTDGHEYQALATQVEKP
jgi:hypothetical protein